MRVGSYRTLVAILIVVFFTAPLVFSQTMRSDGPKQEGTTRVGLVIPYVTLIGGGGSVTQETATLQKNVISYLSGPRIGTINIKAKLEALALEEAKERECDFVIFISLTRKRRAVAKGASSGYGSGTRAGDEFVFEYKIVPAAGGKSNENSLKGSVGADGEDVLTPMIENMAQVVVGLAKTSRPTPTVANNSGSSSAGARPDIKTNTEPVVPTSQSSEPTDTPKPATGYGSLSAPARTTTAKVVNDPPKTPGTIRIGFLIPRIVGGGMNTGNGDAAALRKTISSYFEGSNIEALELKARLDGLAVTEAQKRECDFVLYTTLTRKRKTSSSGGALSGIFGSIGGGGIGNKVPGTKTAREIGSEASRVGGGIASLAKANDEMTFEYKLVTSAGARLVVEKVTTAKVKADGDDVLSPMLEKAAQAIVDATRKN